MRKLILILAALLVAGVASAVDYEIVPGYGIPQVFTLHSGTTTAANGNTLTAYGAVATIGCYVSWGSTCGQGVVTFETASSPTYAGTWVPLSGGVVTFGSASTQVHFQVDGLRIYTFRARVSTSATGNGVTVTCTGGSK